MTFTSLYFKGGVGDAGGCVGFAASVVVFWPLNPPGASIPSQSEFRKEIKQGRDASERQGVASFVCLAGAEVEGSAKAVDVPSPSVSPRDSCVSVRVLGGQVGGQRVDNESTVSPLPSLSPPRRRGSNDPRAQNNSSTGLVIVLFASPDVDVFGPNDSITAMGSAELLRLPDKSSPGTKAFADAVIFLPIEPLDAGAVTAAAPPLDVDIAAFFTSALSSSSSPKSMPLESTTSDTVSPIIASVTTSGRLINPLDPDVLIA